MSNVLYAHYRAGARPAREQNLFISLSKHHYCLSDGTLKYQNKPIDPRIPGKRLITRFVLLDVDTGTVYGECHTEEGGKDIAGFLARAWAKKPDHPMRGIPSILNVPLVALKDPDYRQDLDLLVNLTGLSIGELPAGFAGGIHAVKAFDKAVDSLFWLSKDKKPNLLSAQACSALLSAEASNSFSHTWNQQWEAIQPPPDSFFSAIDSLYKEPGEWRLSPFDNVLNGLAT